MRVILAILIVINTALVVYGGATRTEFLHSDMMNYVDVARNLTEGKGFVQSAVGFNETRGIGELAEIDPYSVQAPLYPLLIAVVAFFGIPHVTAAYAITGISLLILLYLWHQISRTLYGSPAALLTVLLLVLYRPLNESVALALSEPFALVWLSLVFVMLLRSRTALNCLLMGVFAGLAFATRYAFALVAFWGIIVLAWEGERWKDKFRNALVFLAGYAMVAAPVFVHNLVTAGYLLPSFSPAGQESWINLYYAINSLMGSYVSKHQTFLTIAVFCSFFFLKWPKQNSRGLAIYFWGVLYFGFIVGERVLSYFDGLGPRLILPSTIPLIMFWGALVANTWNLERKIAPLGIGALALFISYQGWQLDNNPYVDRDYHFNESPDLRWVQENTAPNDLIIANHAVDIPFFVGREHVLSYSFSPDTPYSTYEDIQKYIANSRTKYGKVYLIFRRYPQEQEADYGPFIQKVRLGDPRVPRVAELSNAEVYRFPN